MDSLIALGSYALMVLVSITGILLVGVLVTTALVDVVRSPGLDHRARFAWIAAIVCFPFVGSCAWYLVGLRPVGPSRIGAPRRLP